MAQLNIAHLKAPIDSPLLADFVANLDRINAIADNAPGFIWRLQTEEGNSSNVTDFGENYIVNLSVWKDMESLHRYVYDSPHIEVMRRRREWFQHMSEMYLVLWWVPVGHIPSTAEAKERLSILQETGPSEEAFTFKMPFPPADA